MPGKRRRPSASCFIPVSLTGWVRCMTVRLKWIGWSRSGSGALRLRLRRPPVSGTIIALILSIPRGTWILRLKSSDPFACWTEPWLFLIRCRESNRSRKRSGVRPISIGSLALSFLIKWIGWVLTFQAAFKVSLIAWKRIRSRSSCQSEKSLIFEGSSTLSR